MLSVAIVPAFCILTILNQCNGQFGVPISHLIDRNLEKMGQASIANWEIQNGEVTLDVVVEDIEDENEIWIIDWQPYGMLANDGNNFPIVNRFGGYLLANNTGPCSSVFASEKYTDTDFYGDEYRPGSTSGKNLFTSYTAGGAYGTKAPGATERFREDTYRFEGTIDTLFDCVDSNGDYVWKQTIYPESIQLNATLYMTNVRPKYENADGSILPSYTENYAVLYWTIMRFALSRFLISSTERLRPIFEYAIVKPVYVNADESQGLDRTRAEVELVFRTVTDSEGYLISVYRPSSLQYYPINTNNGLSYVSTVPDYGCSEPMGMEDLSIGPGFIIATTFKHGFPPENARLNGAGAWSPTSDVDQHIQVTFISMVTVTGLITQGFQYSDHVAGYMSQYSVEIRQLTQFLPLEDENGDTIIFNGNFDADTPVPNYFANPVELLAIRIVPVASVTTPILRFEILGCVGILEDNDEALHAPECDYVEYPGMCTQRWIFGVVLDVEVPSSAGSTDPLDATGEFELKFKTYTCPDIRSGEKSTCEVLDVPDAVISNLVSLQSVVDIEDGEIDEASVLLKRVYGALNPNGDLREGFAPGVSHLETVFVETHFFPELLRQRLELELTLFVVCIGNQYEYDIGCLAAPESERYFAYIADDFFFEFDDTLYNPSVIEDATQELESHSYDYANEKHVTTFVNRALSGQARNYTITNVFQLKERYSRKKREVVRRDVLASISVPENMNFRLMFRGCPEDSTHNAETLDCVCNNLDESYSGVTFKCEKNIDLEEETTNILEVPFDIQVEDKDPDSGSQRFSLMTSLILTAVLTSFIL